jgi:Tol biopolymer transport system component
LSLTNSPTITGPLMVTGVGALLGTAAYMSPEQAAGKGTDTRSDIWAFGVVLLEMLTGRPVFAGETVSKVLAAVLKDDPDWTRLPANTPPAIRRLLRRCLEKDRTRRLASAADARLEVDEALTADPEDAGFASAPSRGPSNRLMWGALTIAVVVATVLAVPATRYLREPTMTQPPETRLDIATPSTSDPVSFALSPDGRHIIFVAEGDDSARLWLRPMTSATSQPMAGTEGAAFPFWSPDSGSVGFFADGQLKRLDLGASAARILAPAPGGRGGTWSADGVILFAPVARSNALSRIPAIGGSVMPLKETGLFPMFLPNGRHFLFYAPGPSENSGIYLGALDGDEATRLTAADAAGSYLPPGWLLWARGGTLVAQRLDLERRALTGEIVTVADSVVVAGGQFRSAVSVSATGLVAYRSSESRRQQLTWFDRGGNLLAALGRPDTSGFLYPRVSPDGQRVAVTRVIQGNADVWILDGARATRFTFHPASDTRPVWSPDGSRILFHSQRDGKLYVKPTSGAVEEEPLAESDRFIGASDWSGDGRFLLSVSVEPQTLADLWVRPMMGDSKAWVLVKTPFAEAWGRFSSDSQWVAYQSTETGLSEIYVRPFVPPGSGASSQMAGGQLISTAGGISPTWSADGRELYYIGLRGELMAVPITTRGTTLEAGTPVVLFHTRISGGGVDRQQGRQYDVTPDGRFLINTVIDEASTPITLIQNWAPGSLTKP